MGAALGGYVADLPVGGLSRQIMHRPGEPARPVHEALIHLLMHSAHHRGELAALLTTLSASPGDLDVMDFLRERDALTPHAEE